MKTYIVETIKHPIELVYACNENEALHKYATDHGYRNLGELLNACEAFCGVPVDPITVQCITNRPH
jgi:hypothetical protein